MNDLNFKFNGINSKLKIFVAIQFLNFEFEFYFLYYKSQSYEIFKVFISSIVKIMDQLFILGLGHIHH